MKANNGKGNNESRDDWEKSYYKYYTHCKKCGIEYGYDRLKDDGYCPICWQRIHSYKSTLERRTQK